MNENKRGRIVADYRSMMNRPEGVLKLFTEIGFFPIRINHDMLFDTVEYAGMSDAFRELSAGEVVPQYRALFEAGETGEIKKCWTEEIKE